MTSFSELLAWVRSTWAAHGRLRIGVFVLLVALGWPLVLPGVLLLSSEREEFLFNSLAGYFFVVIPTAALLLLGLILLVIPRVRKWRVSRGVTVVVLCLFLPGGLRVGYEKGVDLMLRTALTGSLATPALLRALSTEAATSRITGRSHAAERCLFALGRTALPRLTAALSDPDWTIRWSAARTLTYLGPAAESAEGALLAAIKDPHPSVRSAAAYAVFLVAPSNRFKVGVLIDVVNGGATLDRLHAAQALSDLGPTAAPAVPALTGALTDPDWAVRLNSAEALGKIGPAAAPAAPALTELLKDKTEDVRKYAAKALELIQRPAPGSP